MASYWNRQYRLAATVNGETGFVIGEPDETGRAAHISFSVEKVASTDSNSYSTSKITLWNLSDTQIATLLDKSSDDDSSSLNCYLRLTAGYGSVLNTVFCGYVSYIQESLDGADKKVEITATDTVPTLATTVVSLSYTQEVSCLTVLVEITNQLSIPVKFSDSARTILNNATFARKYSYVGYVNELLDKICSVASSYLTWTIASGVLYIKYKSEGTSTYIHELNASTGLISIPKRCYSSTVTDEDSDESLYGYYYEADYLLNAAIECGGYVHLTSDIITGTFYVSTISISGDNLEGDWKCTAKLIASSDDSATEYVTSGGVSQ